LKFDELVKQRTIKEMNEAEIEDDSGGVNEEDKGTLSVQSSDKNMLWNFIDECDEFSHEAIYLMLMNQTKESKKLVKEIQKEMRIKFSYPSMELKCTQHIERENFYPYF